MKEWGALSPIYTLVFDAAKQRQQLDNDYYTFPIVFGLMAIFARQLSQFQPRRGPPMLFRIIGISGCMFSIWWSYNDRADSIGHMKWFAKLEKDNRLSVDEGCLESFHPMPKSGHENEWLVVNGKRFQYSTFVIDGAFNRTEAYGGPIHRDTLVRISSSDGQIVRLEVKQHACPSAPLV